MLFYFYFHSEINIWTLSGTQGHEILYFRVWSKPEKLNLIQMLVEVHCSQKGKHHPQLSLHMTASSFSHYLSGSCSRFHSDRHTTITNSVGQIQPLENTTAGGTKTIKISSYNMALYFTHLDEGALIWAYYLKTHVF